MINMKYGLLAVTAAAFIAAPAQAQTMLQDGSPIVLKGTVAEVTDEEFTMMYDGTNFITVEMGDWDLFDEDETSLLTIGDEVVVSGEIDDGLFDSRALEADTVYLVTDSAFYSRDEDAALPIYLYSFDVEQDLASRLAAQEPAAGDMTGQDAMAHQQKSWISAVGTVQNIDGNMVTIDAGEQELTVDLTEAAKSPAKISEGDKLFISGTLDQAFFDNQELTANRVVTLSQNQQMMNKPLTQKPMNQDMMGQDMMDQEPMSENPI